MPRLTTAGLNSIDSTVKFCKAAFMFGSFEKYFVVLLAIWLPVFSGNAFAASISMHLMDGDCHYSKQYKDAHNASNMFQYSQHTDCLAQQIHQNDQKQPSHKACGVCHAACCGYMAVATAEITAITLLSLPFTSEATRFQSVTTVPLVPPPLSRA
jgi:hypothetical protein